MLCRALTLVAVGLALGQSPSPDAVEVNGLHNVFRIMDGLYSGSSPEGDAGFNALTRLGIKTIISVDGARPDLERARRFGMRYVHLPVGYDGISQQQSRLLAKAVRDLPGPVYLHCHHGMHRGPAAAAVIHLCLDDQCQVASALKELSRAGTDPRYVGLFESLKTLRRPSKQELDALPAQFPEAIELVGLAQHMAGVDERWDHLKLIRAAGWKVPTEHPDIDPVQEAVQLREHFRESARIATVDRRPDELRRWLQTAEKTAGELEGALREGKAQGMLVATTAEAAFRKGAASCVSCHVKYRDPPRR